MPQDPASRQKAQGLSEVRMEQTWGSIFGRCLWGCCPSSSCWRAHWEESPTFLVLLARCWVCRLRTSMHPCLRCSLRVPSQQCTQLTSGPAQTGGTVSSWRHPRSTCCWCSGSVRSTSLLSLGWTLLHQQMCCSFLSFKWLCFRLIVGFVSSSYC